MNALPRGDVRKANARRQYSHPHLSMRWLEAFFFKDLDCIGPAIASHDDSFVCHGAHPPCPRTLNSAAQTLERQTGAQDRARTATRPAACSRNGIIVRSLAPVCGTRRAYDQVPESELFRQLPVRSQRKLIEVLAA